MKVRRHYDVLEHVPDSTLAVCDGLHDHPRHVRLTQMVDMVHPVQPGLHLREHATVNLEPGVAVIVGEPMCFRREDVDAVLTLLRDGAGEVDRDEVAAVDDFPVGESAVPEGDGFRPAGHTVGPASRAGLFPPPLSFYRAG